MFWIDVTASLLFETNTSGVIQGAFPLDNPGTGIQGGMDLLTDGSGLVVADCVADAFYAIGFDGVALSPDPLFSNPGVFGNGIARLEPTAPTAPGYEIATGDLAAGQVTTLVTVMPDGSPVGCEVTVGNPNVFIDDVFVNGIALTETGPTGCGTLARYVVGNATNSVYATSYVCDPTPPTPPFIRGDANGDGNFNALAEALFLLNAGFIFGSALPPCFASADANGDRALNFLVDALYILNFGFVPGSPPPPPPFPDCGEDANGVATLGCDVPPPCP